MVAGFRALENEQPKPLFHDPLAAKLVGDHGKEILATIPRHFVGAWSVVIRTVIIDDYIRQAVAAGVDTILNLGAGLDTRPYRIELPSSLRWIEVDFPHMIELKETRLADEKPGCRLERIKLDLTDRALRRRLFSNVNARAGKILVLTEGVIPYLTNEDVAELADDLRQAKKIGFWITDYFSPEAIRYGEKMRARFMRNAPFQVQSERLVLLFRRAWLAGFRDSLHRGGSEPARPSHSAVVLRAGVDRPQNAVRLARAPGQDEEICRVRAPGPGVTASSSGRFEQDDEISGLRRMRRKSGVA
jgi:methyltransferase (TIGR00027 family)